MSRRRQALHAALEDEDVRAVAWMLERRGLTFVEANPVDRLILPADATPEEETALYLELKRYSSRILVRGLIQSEAGRLVPSRFATDDIKRELMVRLEEIRVVEPGNGGWRLRREGGSPHDRPLHSFGDTLEWFVAQVFRRELHVPAAWGVVVRGNAVGGDLDVVAEVERHFLLAEVKSSPPKHVELEGVRAFVQRVAALRPAAALFIEDTELRMSDKIVPLFADALAERRGNRDLPIERLEHELFLVGEGIYVVNARADLAANIRTCVAHFLRSRGIGDL